MRNPDDWISPTQAAALIGAPTTTVFRSTNSVDALNKFWGAGNWIIHPLHTRRTVLLRRSRVEQLADTLSGSPAAA